MDWLNLHTSVLDSPEFLGADPVDRATWLCLMRYCIGQENSGIIDNCANWGDRKWQQLCRVTLKETRRECDLFEWMDGSLIVRHYPIEKQNEVQRLRAQAKCGADARWHASRHPDGNAEGKGMERKEVEGEARARETATPPSKMDLFAKYLGEQRLSPSEAAVREWLKLAKEMGCSCQEDTLEMVESAVKRGRDAGKEVRYARHVEAEARLWAEKRTTRRIIKESA